MYEEKTVGVVVPAYNEEGKVGGVIADAPPFVDRIYVVDDDSTDGTWDEIRAAAAERNERDETGPFEDTVVPLRHTENRGVGGAITTGYQRAAEDGVDATAVMAGDGQMDPERLERYLDPVVTGRADYAKGNRFLRRDDRQGMPTVRVFGTVLLTSLTRIASGYWSMGDPQNGYTVISGRALERLDLDALYEDYGFANDLLVRLNVHDLRVAEVPDSATYSEEWSSDIEYTSFVPQLSALLARNYLWRLKEKYLVRGFDPLVGGYLFGAGSVGAGVVGGLAAARRRGKADGGLAAWLLVILAGVGLFLLGATLDKQDNADRSVHATE